MTSDAGPKRPGLDYVSPLPPVRSGIADYGADLLPLLAPLCDLRVVTVPGQPVAARFRETYTTSPPDRLGEHGRVALYHVGNNPYHREIVDLALQHPGVVVLHDVFLHHLLHERTLAEGDLDGYVDELVACHGWLGGTVALAPRWCAYGHAPLFTFPVHRRLLRRQRGVLVHSRWAAERVAEGDPELVIRTVPMPMPVPAPQPERARALRAAWGVPEGALLLGSFGFQTPIKRTSVVLRALAEPALRDVWLVIVGEVSPALDLEGEARAHGVADRVRVVGYLPSEDFTPAIDACDLAVNLRYPTAGETSASLLRVLAQGTPALVSDYAQFAELPDDAVVKIPLPAGSDGDDEVAALVDALRVLLSHPERLRERGAAARALIEREHDPERAAVAILEATFELAGLPAGTEGPPLELPRPTSLTWGALAGTIAVDGLAGWAPGERRRFAVTLRNTGFARWLAGRSGLGGVALRVRLLDERGRDRNEDAPWLPLPRDLEPGEELALELALRRPLGRFSLRIEPHVLGGPGLSRLGGPWFESELGEEAQRLRS